MPRLQPLLAERVVGGDLLVVDAGDVEQERDNEPGAVLPAHAVHDDAALGRARDRGDRRGDVLAEALEEDEIDLTCRRRVVGGSRRSGLDLGERLLVLSKNGTCMTSTGSSAGGSASSSASMRRSTIVLTP